MGVKENFVPNYTDSITLEGPEDTLVFRPHLRIPLSQDSLTI